jgi:hypothetical protein
MISATPDRIKAAVAEERKLLQTDLWALLQVLYPPEQGNYWSEGFHRPVCDFLVKKDPDRHVGEWDTLKQRLYLDPRNHFKTTIDVSDIVQYILAWPDIRVLIASGTRDHALRMLGAVQAHFKYNPVLRDIFPELCPPAHKVEDWGRQDSFVCPGRKQKTLREPTVGVASPDSAVASSHWDVLKFDDIVNESNSKTTESLATVNKWFKLSSPLLETYGYRDVIGTRYDFSDVYGQAILGDNDNLPNPALGIWHNGWVVFRRDCFDQEGRPRFPERWQCQSCRAGKSEHDPEICAKQRLERERTEMGTFLFSAQYLNEPVPSDSQIFPLALVERAFVAEA